MQKYESVLRFVIDQISITYMLQLDHLPITKRDWAF
jgi:hypothetical protein